MPSHVIVIFGASGDLTARKLVPSLFSLHRKGRLPDDLHVVGTARAELDDAAFRRKMREGLPESAVGAWDRFAEKLHYLPGDMTRPEFYAELDRFVLALESEPAHRLYYLSTAPRLFPVAVANLGRAGMVDEARGARRVIIEKPFGRDRGSAEALNEQLHAVLREPQVYRIDHYLGKETVQNLLVFRFSNAIFEPLWNRNYVDHVQITVAESVGVGHRAGYYDRAGALRDMVQNHLLQLLTLVALEPPARFEADMLRNEKVKVLNAIRPIRGPGAARDTILAQYRGYHREDGVAEGSRTPTYAALRLFVDNWRWQGIPFYLRTGKCLKRKVSEIDIHFRRPPLGLLGGESCNLTSNRLSICLQPDEGVHLRFETKVPDEEMQVRAQDLEFHYDEAYGETPLPDAYERLLLDALQGDASLFTRSDEIALAWELVDAIQQGWEGDDAPALAEYAVGSWGPPEADELIARHGRAWTLGCLDH